MRHIHRVVLIDDHETLRDLLKAELRRRFASEFDVVGEGATGREAVEVCRAMQPDLLVQDLLLPGEVSGLEALRQLSGQLPQMRVLIFSGCVQQPLIAQAVTLGVAGFVRKAQPLQSLFSAMRAVRDGGNYFEPGVIKIALDARDDRLTVREREVAQLVASGKSTKEVAATMGVSVKTVDKHRTRMMHKLNVHDAVAVTRYAIEAGLVSLN